MSAASEREHESGAPAEAMDTHIAAGEGSGAPSVAQQNMHFIEETGRWTYTDAEGVSFEYDENLKAWFPMFDEQLIQAQQSAYGETIPEDLNSVYAENERRQKRKKNGSGQEDIDNVLAAASAATTAATAASLDDSLEFPPGIESIPGRGEGSNKYNNDRANKKQKHGKEERKPKPITSVFVMGLPLDTDVDEVAEVFKKGGVFMEDENENPRIKLYANKEGQRTGEALVTYLRHESVPLAIDLLDDTEYRPGVDRSRIRVQQAQFKEKEKTATPPGLSEERKKKVQKKFQKMEKKLDWFEDDEGLMKAEKWTKVCILKHMFTIQELEADPTLLLDLKEDIREECEKMGEVTNVIIYDHHPEGVVSVRFKDKESAELCVKFMSGRFFAGQRVVAEIYDGHTKYEIQKSKEELELEEKQRLDRYARWLETEEEKNKLAQAGSSSTSGSAQVMALTADDDDEPRIAADAPTP
ncbi:hypothetical protein KVV02_005859 [Mortierella alpina]|uniref:RRM domain-containing protein n=1 Tax=Mortierella alpina TaxID=64518 RepID=A0A9P7ZXB8_MORAP|nr:hypothetical protein KVV02_005859 [Mortierella alpina]